MQTQIFDDGSTLTVDDYGNVSSTPAPNYGGTPTSSIGDAITQGFYNLIQGGFAAAQRQISAPQVVATRYTPAQAGGSGILILALGALFVYKLAK